MTWRSARVEARGVGPRSGRGLSAPARRAHRPPPRAGHGAAEADEPARRRITPPSRGGHLTAPATVVVLGRVARFPTNRPVMSDIGLGLAVGGGGEETSPGLSHQARQRGAPRRARAKSARRPSGPGPTADAGTRRSGIDASVHGPVLGYWLTTEEGRAQTPNLTDRLVGQLDRKTVRCSVRALEEDDDLRRHRGIRRAPRR